MCSSTGISLKYKVESDFSRGGPESEGACLVSFTYEAQWAPVAAAAVRVQAEYNYRMTVTDVGRTPSQSAAKEGTAIAKPGATAGLRNRSGGAGPLAWTSMLDVAGASGQILVNGRTLALAAEGRSTGNAPSQSGTNRIEATLVESRGGTGTWRFELTSTERLRAGSLRVVAGSVAEITADSVVFRLTGSAGERIAFTFELD
jgi:hypothetical protein